MEEPSELPAVASVMLSLAMLALGSVLLRSLWRSGLSFSVAGRALLGALLAFLAGATLPWPSNSDTLVIASGFGGVAVAAAGSNLVTRRREEHLATPASGPTARDPGWPWWELLRIMFLVGLLRPSKATREPLISLRWIFLALVASLLLYWVAISFLIRDPSEEPVTGASVAIVTASALATAVALIVGKWQERRVVMADGDALVNTYRTVFFLRIGLTEIGPLLGFAGAFIAAGWVYPAALACSIPAWISLAPSARNLIRIDEARRGEGRVGSLYERLLEMPPDANGA